MVNTQWVRQVLVLVVGGESSGHHASPRPSPHPGLAWVKVNWVTVCWVKVGWVKEGWTKVGWVKEG